MHILSHRGVTATVLSLALVTASCVDAPSAPEGFRGAAPFSMTPVFSLVAPSGPPVSPTQASALSEAFDRVDQFRMIVKNVGGQIVLDTVIAVTPGAAQYDLNVEVPATAGESFLVTLVALEGGTELFKAESIPVQSTPPGASGGASPAVDIPLTYSGPGAAAVAVELAPEQTVVGPGGTAQLGAKVLDDQGAVIADTPLSWTSTVSGVATVGSSGMVTGVADGITEVVVTSPTGLTARAWVYVVSGTLAYVQGGVLKVRSPAGGEAETRSSGAGASGPTWAGDALYYSESGAVRRAGSSATLLNGAWPSVSPDGGKVAADGGGTLVFANIDGTNVTEGPSGTTPVWTDWATLVVGGGSIQQVQADGTSRSTLVGGGASLPALSNGGSLAYVSDGQLMVQGRPTPLAEVGGRPAWSPDGAWIVAPGGGGLLLVPAGGSAPPVLLPDLEGASDPAWQGTASGGGGPPGLNLTGLSPEPAIPGQETSILGTGFDIVIPANNKLFWPGPDGAVPGEILSVTGSAIRSVMPRDIVPGQIRVENRDGTAVLEYVPSVGSIEVNAMTPWGTPVPGVGVRVTDAVQNESAAGSTGGQGIYAAEGLLPGSYTVEIAAPPGFVLQGEASRTVVLTAAVSFLDLTLVPSVASVTFTPERPRVGVLDEVRVVAQAFDVNGSPIPEVGSVTWGSGSSKLDVWNAGELTTTIVGRQPSATEGDAPFAVTIDGRTFGVGATVTSYISGTIVNASDEKPASGVAVRLEADESVMATTATDIAGRYQFSGLLAGSYVVRPAPSGGRSTSPSSTPVQLSRGNTRGVADFTVTSYGGNGGSDRPNVMLCGSSSRNPETFFPVGDVLTLLTGCTPDGDTQALLVSRSGASSVTPGVLQAYLNGGGVVITEYNITYTVFNKAFGTNATQGARNGACWDRIPTVVQFNPGDPFWLDNAFVATVPSETGCGYAVGNLPGITPLGGWTVDDVSIGYRNLGAGRFWATDFDWQDNEGYEFAYTATLLGYMISHRR